MLDDIEKEVFMAVNKAGASPSWNPFTWIVCDFFRDFFLKDLNHFNFFIE